MPDVVKIVTEQHGNGSQSGASQLCHRSGHFMAREYIRRAYSDDLRKKDGGQSGRRETDDLKSSPHAAPRYGSMP